MLKSVRRHKTMKAEFGIAGKKYLSKNGTPVIVTGFKDGKVLLKSDATGNEIKVSKNYPLQEYDEKKVNSESKTLIKSNGNGKKGQARKSKEGTLASAIDPLLFAGGKTVAEIVAVIEKKKLPAAKGKDLNANVRARMVNYSRKGYKIEKTDDKKVKVIKPGK
jgi:hypothetical protein